MTERFLAVLLIMVFLIIPGQVSAAVPDPFAHCAAPGSEEWWSRCYYDEARNEGAWEQAAVRLRAASELLATDPYLAFDLGRIQLRLHDFRSAEELLRQAATGFAARGDQRLEAYARANRANCLGFLGRTEAKGIELERTERAATAAGEHRLIRETRILRAGFLRNEARNLEHALRLLQRIEHDLRPEDTPAFRYRLLAEMGLVLRAMGRKEEAYVYDRSWAELAQAQGDKYQEANARVNMAVSFTALPPRSGAREEAIELTRRALFLAAESENLSAEAGAREILGTLLPGEEGRAHLRRCADLAAASRTPARQAYCVSAIAGSLVADNPEQARSTLDESFTLALSSDNPWTVAYGWTNRFRVRWATLSRDEAIADSLAMLDFIEALRRLQDSETGRVDFFAKWTDAYYGLAGRLLKVEGGPSHRDLEIAFAVAERMRARTLLDSLAASRATPSAPADETVTAERTVVLRDIVRVQRRLQTPVLSQDERTALLTELDALELALAEIEDRLGFIDSMVVSPADLVTLSEVEASLAPTEALFTFLVGLEEDLLGHFTGGSWLIVTTRDGTRAYPLPERMLMETKVNVFLGLVEDTDESALDIAAGTLYDDLLAPALADLSDAIDTLVLVPDGVLHLLPFSLLRPYPQELPLAERFRLTTVPSATLWHLFQDEGNPASRSAALALADPAFASAEDDNGDDAEAADRLWALGQGARLGRLPHARREGRVLVRRLGGAPSRVLEGEEATERFLKSARLGDFGILHFAAHALIDERRPHRSAVLLAAGGAEEDGLLQPREIADLDLKDKLVVLSACQGASGQVFLGEGIESLARAFLRAEARTVVASRWPLKDDHAADFFDAFYRALAQGESVSAAVAHAARKRRAAGAPAAAWAGITVIGDGDLVPVPGGVARFPSALALVPALAILALLGFLVRRRRIGHQATP